MSISRNDARTLSGLDSGDVNGINIPSTTSSIIIGGNEGTARKVVGKSSDNVVAWVDITETQIEDGEIITRMLNGANNYITTGNFEGASLTTSGNASIGGNLSVSGDITLDDIISDDITFKTMNGRATIPDGTLNITMNGANGSITTTGDFDCASSSLGTANTTSLTNTGTSSLTGLITSAGGITFTGGAITGKASPKTIATNLDLSDSSNVIPEPQDIKHQDIIFYRDLLGTDGDGGTQKFSVSGNSGDVNTSGDVSAVDLTASGNIGGVNGSFSGTLSATSTSTLTGLITSAGGITFTGGTITGKASPKTSVTNLDLSDSSNVFPANETDIKHQDITFYRDLFGTDGDGGTQKFSVSGNTGNLNTSGTITSTGNISSSGNVSAVDGTFSGNVSITGDLTYDGDFKTEDLTIFKSLTMTNGDGGGSTATFDATNGDLTLGGSDSVAGDGNLSMPFGFISSTATGGTSATGHSFSDSVWFRKDIEFTNSLSKVKMDGAGSELDMTTSANSKILGYTSGHTTCKNLDLSDTSNKFPDGQNVDSNTYIRGCDPASTATANHAGSMTGWRNLLGYTSLGNRIPNGDLTFTATGTGGGSVRMYFEIDFFGNFSDGAWFLGMMEIDPDDNQTELGIMAQSARVIFSDSTKIHSGQHRFITYQVLTAGTEYVVAPYIYTTSSTSGTQGSILVGGNAGITDPTDSSQVQYPSYRILAQPTTYFNFSFSTAQFTPV